MNLSELIRFLENKWKTGISIEIADPVFSRTESLNPDPGLSLHRSAFCQGKKLADGNRTCGRNKKECMKRCTTEAPFLQTCPHGVTELVTPVRLGNRLYAVIFAGIRPDEAVCREYSRFLADWIRYELENAIRNQGAGVKRRNADFYTEECLNFIERHYMEPVLLTDLTDFLHVNPNYIGGLLKKRFGKNFHALLTERRLREARIYLCLHRQLSIGRISALCGFSDSNYFSLVFRRHCGVSPREYRENAKN